MASPKKRKSISAASVFKRHPRDANRRDRTAKSIALVSGSTADVSPFQKTHNADSRLRMRSLRNKIPENREGRQKSPDKHPLVADFNETTKVYRHHLYETTVAQINKTHDTLVESLHNANVQPISELAKQDRNGVSCPLNLTPAELLKRQTEGMHTPISSAIVEYPGKNRKGEEKFVMTTLGERINSFKVFIKREVEDVEILQQKWECVVGEIWKCGIQILGQEKMSELLDLSADAVPQPEAKSTLLAHEDGGDELRFVGEAPKSKKRVSFKDDIPAFLTEPSKIIVPAQPLPDTPEEEIRELENAVAKLGAKELAELGTLYKMQDKWWEKKTKQLKTVWESED